MAKKDKKNEQEFDFNEYLDECKNHKLAPCSPEEFMSAAWLMRDTEIPFKSNLDTIWLLDLSKKRRNQRPLLQAYAEMKEQRSLAS